MNDLSVEILVMLFGVGCSIGGAWVVIKVSIAKLQKDVQHIEKDIIEMKESRLLDIQDRKEQAEKRDGQWFQVVGWIHETKTAIANIEKKLNDQ